MFNIPGLKPGFSKSEYEKATEEFSFSRDRKFEFHEGQSFQTFWGHWRLVLDPSTR